MSAVGVTGVRFGYFHETKEITPGPILALAGGATLKWYDIALASEPVPEAIRAMARDGLVDAAAAGALDVAGFGFVILHRCGDAFYFLLTCTWNGDNELWETVWAKDGADASFAAWPLPEGHHPTFCVWELGAVLHEQRAWSRLLRSARHESDVDAYLGDSYRGTV